MKKLLILFSILFTTQVAGEQTASGGSEIFSKQDAAAMFEFSLKEWKINVTQAKKAGVADYDTDGDLAYTMIFYTPDGKVVFTPSFQRNDTSRPWKLSVAIVFSGLQALPMQMMTDDQLKKAFVEDIYWEMLPEFTVFSNIELPDVMTVVQSVQIFEAGFDEIIDKQAAKQLGCFQNCVVRSYLKP